MYEMRRYVFGMVDDGRIKAPRTVYAQRLRDARLRAGHESASEAAKVLGISASRYLSYENGHRRVTEEESRRIARVFGFKNASLIVEPLEEYRVRRKLEKDLKSEESAAAMPQSSETRRKLDYSPISNVRRFPMLSARNEFIEIIEGRRPKSERVLAIEGTTGMALSVPVAEPQYSERSFVFTQPDKSMTRYLGREQVIDPASILEGDNVVIDPERTPSPGDIVLYVPTDRDGGYLRKLRRELATDRRTVDTYLDPLNPDYESRLLGLQDLLVGVAVLVYPKPRVIKP